MSIEFTQVIEMDKIVVVLKKNLKKREKYPPEGLILAFFYVIMLTSKIFDPVTSESSALFDAQDAGTAVNRRHSSASGRFPLLPANQFQNPFAADLQEDFDFNYR